MYTHKAGIALFLSGSLAVGVAGGYVITHRGATGKAAMPGAAKVEGEKFVGNSSTVGGDTNHGNGQSGNGTGAGQANKQFSVTDKPNTLTMLYPATAQYRQIVIGNPNNFAIIVTSVSAVVGQPVDTRSRPISGCPTAVVTVDPLTQPVSVPANGSVASALLTHMSAASPDACKNASFPITYSGTATK